MMDEMRRKRRKNAWRKADDALNEIESVDDGKREKGERKMISNSKGD